MGWTRRFLVVALLVPLGALVMGALPARAANTPTFRDCSLFVPGFDPDFVQLSGVTVNNGSLSVAAAQKGQVKLTASESSDPGDSSGHVTLHFTVTAPNVPTQQVSGAEVGKVVSAVPLIGAGRGRTYNISWSATFDNGNHSCPSSSTPENTSPQPFKVTIS